MGGRTGYGNQPAPPTRIQPRIMDMNVDGRESKNDELHRQRESVGQGCIATGAR